jgi:DNA polymerase III epsilon subunit-like protein
VAHNARFDWNFVSAELMRSRALTLDGSRLCTVRLARRLVKGVRSCGLDNLCRFFGFDNRARHRAAGDALVTAELLYRLLSLAREEGARTLQDLALIESRRIRARRRKRRAMPTEPRADSCEELM